MSIDPTPIPMTPLPTMEHKPVMVPIEGVHKRAECMWCHKPITYTSDPAMHDKQGTVYSVAGLKEVQITSSCEVCFDSMFPEDDEVTEDESDDEMVMDIPKAELPGMWEASDISGGEADTANDMKRDREYDPGYQHAVEERYDEGRNNRTFTD